MEARSDRPAARPSPPPPSRLWQVSALIDEKLPSFLPPETGDVAGQLRRFLLESGLPEASLSVQVLKCIHQEIIFPAVSQLRFSIYTILPYKDLKGEWRVRVNVDDDQIRIAHRRWEQTQDWDACNFFKFQWALTLTFDRRMAALQARAPAHIAPSYASPSLHACSLSAPCGRAPQSP